MLDLRQFAAWCHQRHVTFFAARRADIEGFARDLEARGRARSTVSRGWPPSRDSMNTRWRRT